MARSDPSAVECALTEPFHPLQGWGPLRNDDLQVLNGILYIVRAGAPLQD